MTPVTVCLLTFGTEEIPPPRPGLPGPKLLVLEGCEEIPHAVEILRHTAGYDPGRLLRRSIW